MALTDLTRISTSGIATGSTIDAPVLRKDVSFHGSQVGVTSALFDSSDDALEFNDNVKLTFGNDVDLKIYHDNGNGLSYIRNDGTGPLDIRSINDIDIRDGNDGDLFIKCEESEGVKLYYEGNEKLEVTNNGAIVTGILTATSFSGPTLNTSGIATFYDLRVSNNLTVEGTTTTLDTNLIGVDRVEIGANSNTDTAIVGIQSGTADIVNLFDGATKVVTVTDTGDVGIGTDNPQSLLHVYSNSAVYSKLESTNGAATFDLRQTNRYGSVNWYYQGTHKWLLGQINQENDISLYQPTGVSVGTPYRIVVKNDGKIGINTTNVTHQMTVVALAANTIIARFKGFNQNSNFDIGTDASSHGQAYVRNNIGAVKVQLNSNGDSYFTGGDVGIGTDNPNHELTVYGDEPNFRLTHTGSTNKFNALYTQVDGTGVEWNSYQDVTATRRPFIFKQYTTEVLRIDSSGFVGIGTDDPGTQLHLYGSTPILRLTDTDTSGPLHTNIDGASGYLTLDVGSVHRDVIITSANQANEIARFEGDGHVGIGTNDPACRMHLLANNDRACVRLHNTYDTPDNVFELQPGISGVTNTGFCIRDVTDSANRFVIDGSGQVGIGTNVPTYQLQVHHSNPGGLLRLLSSHEGDYDLRFVYQNSEANIWSYGSKDMTFGTRYAKKLHLVTNGPQKRLTVDDGGNVGIGSVIPAAKLDVAGRVQINYGGSEGNAGTVLTVKGSQADTSSTVDEQFKNSPIKVIKTISQAQLRGGLIDGWDSTIHAVGIAMRYDGSRYHMGFGVNNNTSDRPTERMTIGGNGDVEINDGNLVVANGHGISFVNNTENETGGGSVSAEVLDDYEEGSWNPIWDSYGGGGAPGSFTYSAQHGIYTKVGRICHCGFYIGWSAMTSAQSGTYATISGLPFAVGTHSDGANNGGSEGATMNVNWLYIPGNGISGKQLMGFAHRGNSRIIMGHLGEKSISAATPTTIHTGSTYSGGSYYIYGEVSYIVGD